MMEALEKRMGWKSDDYTMLFNEIFLNAVMGWYIIYKVRPYVCLIALRPIYSRKGRNNFE